jgi:branched-chain amino acid transport system substrate-binding protein
MLGVRWFGAIAAAAVATLGCGGQAVQQSASSSSQPINVYVIGPQSGQSADLGDWDWKGVSLAVGQANAKGGVAGRRIALTRYDDTSDPTTGANLAERAASDRVTAVFGPPQSTVALAALPILTGARIPEMTSAQSGALITKGSKYIFLDSATSPAFDSTLADHLVQKLQASSIAVISNNGAFGVSEHDAFLKELGQLSVKPVGDRVVTPDQKDFTAVLTDIRSANPRYLFIGTEEVEAGLIAKQARSLGLTATFAIGPAGVTPTYLNTAGASIVEGTIVSSPYLTNDASSQSRAFAAAYQKAYGQTPELHGAKAYDGMNVLIGAMRKTPNDLSGPKLADAIRSLSYHGLLGTFDYDATGLAIKKTQIGVLKNGAIVPAS